MCPEKICWCADVKPQATMQECCNGVVMVESMLPGGVDVGEFVCRDQLQELGT